MWHLCENEEEQVIAFFEQHPHNDGKVIYTHISRGYESEEELRKGMGILDEPCKLCGRQVVTHWMEPTKSQIIEKNYCFTCNFWDERLKRFRANSPEDVDRIMIVNNQWYYIDREDSNSHFRGFGGRKFIFQKGDKIFESTNVWYGGRISKEFLKDLPDNAVILSTS
jgi:hypothetical protein